MLTSAGQWFVHTKATGNTIQSNLGSFTTDNITYVLRTDDDFKITVRRQTDTKDLGPRTRDHGPCFGTNDHPRRDTDVILRLSKFTIEDLSFYVGF